MEVHFIYMHEYSTIKTPKNTFKRGKGGMGLRKSDGWSEHDQIILYACMQISQ
jgi:hypothetical protein